jgi:hypothetical protein
MRLFFRHRQGTTGKQVLIIAATAVVFIVLASCSGSETGTPRASLPSGSESSPRETQRLSIGDAAIYVCDGGTLREISGFDALEEEQGEPWTVQERVAGFLRVGDILYCGINGAGLVPFTIGETGLEKDRTVKNPGLFAGRTIGKLFFYRDTLYCHLYYNAMFDTARPDSAPVFLVTLRPGDNHFEIVGRPPGSDQSTPTPDEQSGWEAADLIPHREKPWAVAWKWSDGEKTEFRYSTLPFDSLIRNGLSTSISWETIEEGDIISRNDFLESYEFLSCEELPPQLDVVVKQELHDPSSPLYNDAPVVVHISVRSPECTSPDRYRLGSLDELREKGPRLLRIPAYRVKNTYYLLFPGGIVYVSERGSSDADNPPRELLLPPLPAGFTYTDIWTDGSTLVASWEQQEFTGVVHAGMITMPLSK